MVLRQLPPEKDAQEQSKRILESVELARQAVQLDVTDGTSWCEYITYTAVAEKDTLGVFLVEYSVKWSLFRCFKGTVLQKNKNSVI